MDQSIDKMYEKSSDVLSDWMDKLFPSQDQGCINFGFWRGIEKPLNIIKRIQSQKALYFEIFEKIDPNYKGILEVGCGRGHGVFWLTEQGYTVYGLDILPNQIELSKTAYPILSSQFLIGKAEEIPFSNDYFDCLYSLEAAQHFISFQKFCDESFRVLKKNGKLIVSTFFLTSSAHTEKLKQIIPDNLEGFHNIISIQEAIELIHSSGFHVDVIATKIGNEVFPCYSKWQKSQLGDVSIESLSEERIKWAEYYTGGGKNEHPWYQAFKNGWIDYYILEGMKID